MGDSRDFAGVLTSLSEQEMALGGAELLVNPKECRFERKALAYVGMQQAQPDGAGLEE